MYAEIKYDGERVQVHKKGSDFHFFSRSLKPVLDHKVSYWLLCVIVNSEVNNRQINTFLLSCLAFPLKLAVCVCVCVRTCVCVCARAHMCVCVIKADIILISSSVTSFGENSVLKSKCSLVKNKCNLIGVQ